jgi:hypothetical protein
MSSLARWIIGGAIDFGVFTNDPDHLAHSVDGGLDAEPLFGHCLCHRKCSARVTTGRAGRVRTQSGYRVPSGVARGLYGEIREFEKRPDRSFKTTAIDHSAIPPRRTSGQNSHHRTSQISCRNPAYEAATLW